MIEGLEKGKYTTYSDMSELYGCDLSLTVETPASTENVFAYASAIWDRQIWENDKEEREEKLQSKRIFSNFSDKTKKTIYRDIYVPSFQPDMCVFEAVFSRWKQYEDIKKVLHKENMLYIDRLNKLKPSIEDFKKYQLGILTKPKNKKEVLLALTDYDTWASEQAIINILKEEYLYRYCELPHALPLPEKYFKIERDILAGKRVMRVKFIVPGIRDFKREERQVINKVYTIPTIDNIKEIQKILLNIVKTIKMYLCGMEKQRNGSKKAIEGMFARKNHATHGIRYKKVFEEMGLKRSTLN